MHPPNPLLSKEGERLIFTKAAVTAPGCEVLVWACVSGHPLPCFPLRDPGPLNGRSPP